MRPARPPRARNAHATRAAAAAALAGLAAALALLAGVARRPSLRREEVSVSPFSARWSQASTADSRFLASLQPDADEEKDADFKRALAIKGEPRTSFTHGETRVSLGPAAVRTIADGSGIRWRSAPAPEVQAAHDAAGSVGTGFGGGDTMRPRMRIGDTVRRMVHDQKATVEYHSGESPQQWADPTTGASFSLGQHDVQRGAYMRWKAPGGAAQRGSGGNVASRADSARNKMREINAGYGGTGGRYHLVIGRHVKELVARDKASVTWRHHESADDAQTSRGISGGAHLWLGPKDRKMGAYIKSAAPIKALEDKINRISAGYGGVGGRAHMVVGRHIKDLVRRNKASVDWRDGESPSNPGLEHQFVGRPRVTLGAKDYLRGAYMRPVKAKGEEGDEEVFRPHAVLVKKEWRRGSHAAWHYVPDQGEPDDKYSVVMPEFVGVRFNNYTLSGPRNLLSKDRIAYHNNYTLRAHAPYTDAVDPCPPASRCAMIKNLNKIHLAGVEHYAGKTWQPSDEAAKNSNWAKFDEQDTDISLCQHCVTRFLADAGPARWLVGRSIEAQARAGTCKPFCENEATSVREREREADWAVPRVPAKT